jgi:SAM-dependent methyltransferase
MTPPITYGAAFADVYDEWYGDTDDLAAVVALLCEHNPKRVLELGVGTGRIALALAAAITPNAGYVVGLDESPEMLAILAGKDEHTLITQVRGDMVTDQPAGPFDLIVFSYNTLFNVNDSQQQAMCVHNAAKRLAPNGRIVIDACIVNPDAPRNGEVTTRRDKWQVHTTSTFSPETGSIDGVTVSTHDDGRCVQRPWQITYQPPSVLDSLATQAGLCLHARYASWHKAPFDDNAERHVSIYRNLR